MKQITVVLVSLLLPLLVLSDAEPEADAEASPTYGRGGWVRPIAPPPPPPPRCEHVYETITRQACTTVSEPHCITESVTNYVTKTEQQCTTTTVPECKVVAKSVPDQQCATRTVSECATAVKEVPEEQCSLVPEKQCTEEEQCATKVETVVDTTYVEECQDVVTQTCTQSQVTSVHSHHVAETAVLPAAHVEVAAPVAPVAEAHGNLLGGHYPHHLGRREAEAAPEADSEADADADPYYSYYGRGGLPAPAAVTAAVSAPACQAVTQRQCRKVPVQTPRHVTVPHCVRVPRCINVPRKVCTTVARQVSEVVCHPKPVTDCVPTVRQVPEKVCVDRPVSQCVPVPHSVPVQVPVQKCHEVPREVCHPVAEKVAKKVCEPAIAYGHHHH